MLMSECEKQICPVPLAGRRLASITRCDAMCWFIVPVYFPLLLTGALSRASVTFKKSPRSLLLILSLTYVVLLISAS